MVLCKVDAVIAVSCTMVVKSSIETHLTCLTPAYLPTKDGLSAGIVKMLPTGCVHTAPISEALVQASLSGEDFGRLAALSPRIAQKGLKRTKSAAPLTRIL